MKQAAALITIFAVFVSPGSKGQKLKVSQDTLVVNMTGKYSITCNATETENSTVDWFEGDESISNESYRRVYQQQGHAVSVLYFQNPLFADEGNYSCGLYQNNTLVASEAVSVTVPTKPIINSIELLSCNGTTSVEFLPHKNAEGIVHRITAVSKSGEIQKNVSEDFGGKQEEILELVRFERYDIKVSPCMSGKCSSKYTAAQSFTAIPTNFEPSNVLMTQESGFYVVKWKHPASSHRKFLKFFRVTVNSSFVFLSPRMNASQGKKVDVKRIPASVLSYSASVYPNRKYSAAVQASACSVLSDDIYALGEFSTDFDRPQTVQAPKIGDPVTGFLRRDVLLHIPNESNGPVRCLLVIAAQTKSNQVPKPFTIDNLNELNTNINNHNDVKAGLFYIAFALELASLNSSSSVLNFTIGDADDVSNCTLNSTTYTGQHWRLTIYKYYSLYLVSATVTQKGKIIFATSNMTTFRNAPTSNSSSMQIEAIIGGSIAAIVIVLMGVGCYRRRNKNTNDRRKSTAEYSATETISGYSTLPRTLPRKTGGGAKEMTRLGNLPTPTRTPSHIPFTRSHAAQGSANTLARKQQQATASADGRYDTGFQTLPRVTKYRSYETEPKVTCRSDEELICDTSKGTENKKELDRRESKSDGNIAETFPSGIDNPEFRHPATEKPETGVTNITSIV